jgi:sugar transferase (PEP-CTERM/EpsH1 system associated)
MRRVTHYADVDSEKWKTYAAKHRGPMRWVYGHEARSLLALERAMSRAYDVTSFVSEADAALYRELAPESADKVRVIANGVDTDYFDPDAAYERPFPDGVQPVVFVGAMDYWPNVDAVAWFATEVLPAVQRELPGAEFWIVGSNPSRQVQDLQQRPGVRVTGRVPDVRPYVARAAAVVAPLRVARGTQNKVLEAYSMARQVVLTGASAAGLIDAPFVRDATHDDPAAMAAAVVQRMRASPRLDAARDYVRRLYSWDANFALLDAALEPAQVLRGR